MSETRWNGTFNLIALPVLAALIIPATLMFGLPGAAAIPLLYSIGMHLFVLPRALAAFGQSHYRYSFLCCLLPLILSPIATQVIDNLITPHIHSRIGLVFFAVSLSVLISTPFVVLVFKNQNTRD